MSQLLACAGNTEDAVADACSASHASLLLQRSGSHALAVQLGPAAALPHDWSVALVLLSQQPYQMCLSLISTHSHASVHPTNKLRECVVTPFTSL